MNSKNVTEISKDYQKRLQNIETETLELIYKDHAKAVEYIKKGRKAVDGEELTDNQLEQIANEIQVIAKMILSERTNE